MDIDPRLPAWNDWKPLGLQQLDTPADDREFSDPVEHEESSTKKAKVGLDDQEREVYYDPDFPQDKLPNAHLTITGESGSGKTQAMKSIMADLNDQHVPALVLDFKDDYADPIYAEREGFRVFDPTKAALPINPLAPSVDSEGLVNPTFHSYQLSEIVSRIYRLGDLQGNKLREAIKAVYTDAGIPMASHRPDADQTWPSFQSVKDKLSGDKDAAELIGHMSPIFDFGLFEGRGEMGGLGGVATSNTVIRLGQLPGNEVKNSVAEFFLMALYNHLIRQPQTSQLQQILVLDEAWRVVNSPFLEPLMRESRAFGLGIFVATQFPTDLPQTVSGNAATKLYFSQSSPTQVNEVARNISGKPYGTPLAEEVGDAVRNLKPIHCLVANKQYSPYVAVAAAPYFARETEEAMTSLPQPTAGANFNESKGEDHRRKAGGPFPEYICPRCQGPTFEAGQACNQCQELVDQFDGADSLGEAKSNFDEWTRTAQVERCPSCASTQPDVTWSGCMRTPDDWHSYGVKQRHELMADPEYWKTAQAEDDRQQCDKYMHKGTKRCEREGNYRVTTVSDGSVSHICGPHVVEYKRLAPSHFTIEKTGHEQILPHVHDDQGNSSFDERYRYDPVVSDAVHDAHLRNGESVNPICGTCDAIKSLHDKGEHDGWFRENKAKYCAWCLDAKTSELQNFPPGEGNDDGDPFAPFATSEWQMVKGPRYRPRGGSVPD